MADKKHKKMMDKLDKKFTSEYGEVFGSEKISTEDIGYAVETYSKNFAANKNLYRIAPNIISGLKPGLTRLLWSWWLFEKKPQNIDKDTIKKLRFVKVDKITSDAQSFHPHGTSALQDLVGTLGQYWSNNVMLIVPQGSYGNMRGDSPAAGR